MPINFFDLHCKFTSTKRKFGLCDESASAYIDEEARNKNDKWIAEIRNPNEIQVDFYAIDNCIEIKKANGDMESRCDGMLYYNKTLIFVELKNREASVGGLKKEPSNFQ